MLQVGAGRRKCKEASEIHKFSTWQQVLQRGNPFSVKGGLREQRQSKFCSKRHHGHVKKISPGSSGHSRPPATAQVFLNFNEREYNHTLLSPPFSRPNLPKREQEQKDPPPPAPGPPPSCPVLSEPQSEPIQTWRQTLRNSARQNTSSGRKTTNNGHHFWLKFGQPS